jgi:hypothetical protein
MTPASSAPKGARPGPKQLSPRGCLLILLVAWTVWVLVDLVRLGVLTGRRSPGDAVFDMPSLAFPLLLAIGLTPVAARTWWQSRRKKAFPDEPWMWERGWDRVGARSLEPARLGAPLVFGISITMTAVMLAFVARYVVESDFLLVALTPFYVIALGFWVWWGYRLARVVRFRGPFFRYATFPFFLGERVQGDLEGVERIEGFTRLTLTLRCVRERWTGSGRSRSVTRETIRQQVHEIGPAGVVQRLVGARAVPPPTGATRPVIPVRFDLPDGDLGTKLLADPARKWELQARAELPGPDFEVSFLVPVYERPRKTA